MIDYNMLDYFYFEKGDLTRYVGWENDKKALETENPALLRAYNAMEDSRRQFETLLKHAAKE